MGKIDLINFTNLTLEEKKMILSWRNNPLIKQWMYTAEDIEFKNHLSFIDSLHECKDKIYFLVKENNIGIGVIDFTNITSTSLDMGIYSSPKEKAKGSILLNEIINYAFNILKVKKIKAEVFSENIKAHDLYKRFNFIDINKKFVNKREVICMELNYENR